MLSRHSLQGGFSRKLPEGLFLFVHLIFRFPSSLTHFRLSYRRSLNEESHQPFDVLRCSRWLKLLGDIPEAAETHSLQAHSLLEFCKQSFDFIACAVRTLVRGRAHQRAHDLSLRLVPDH